LKEAGDLVYLIGDFAPTFGGSHFALLVPSSPEPVPGIPGHAPALYRALHAAIRGGLVRACHDLSEGGLAVAAAEMCIGGRLGLALELAAADPVRALFGETAGCLLVEVRPEHAAAFESRFAGLPVTRLGTVAQEPELVVNADRAALVALPVTDLVNAWNSGS
jgi:phosphoribosylformylglycinamidine (FGAM) synthase-like enzyme